MDFYFINLVDHLVLKFDKRKKYSIIYTCHCVAPIFFTCVLEQKLRTLQIRALTFFLKEVYPTKKFISKQVY